MEELGTHAENVLGLFMGRRSSRRLSSSLTKRRLTEHAKANVDESVEAIDQYKKELADLQARRQQAEEAVNASWGDVVNKITEITLTPKKSDIFARLFGVAWMPYYIVQSGAQTMELPAFGAE